MIEQIKKSIFDRFFKVAKNWGEGVRILSMVASGADALHDEMFDRVRKIVALLGNGRVGVGQYRTSQMLDWNLRRVESYCRRDARVPTAAELRAIERVEAKIGHQLAESQKISREIEEMKHAYRLKDAAADAALSRHLGLSGDRTGRVSLGSMPQYVAVVDADGGSGRSDPPVLARLTGHHAVADFGGRRLDQLVAALDLSSGILASGVIEAARRLGLGGGLSAYGRDARIRALGPEAGRVWSPAQLAAARGQDFFSLPAAYDYLQSRWSALMAAVETGKPERTIVTMRSGDATGGYRAVMIPFRDGVIGVVDAEDAT